MIDVDFILSQTDGRPMYLQIIEQIKSRVALGDWPQGAQLPSIRELAVGLKVSVITIKRAYQELESGGVIVTLQGKGSFVAEKDELAAELVQQQIDNHLNSAIKLAISIGEGSGQLHQRLDQLADNSPIEHPKQNLNHQESEEKA